MQTVNGWMVQTFISWPHTDEPMDMELFAVDARELHEAKREARDAMDRLARAYGTIAEHHHVDTRDERRYAERQAYKLDEELDRYEAIITENEWCGRYYHHFCEMDRGPRVSRGPRVR